MRGDLKKIAIFSLQGIGNAILSLPLASGIKKRWPDANVTLILNSPRVAKVLQHHDSVDKIYSTSQGMWLLVSELRKENFDLALFSFPSAFRSHLIGYLSGIKTRIGHRIPDRNGFFLTSAFSMLDKKHDLEQNLALLEKLGIDQNIDKQWPPLASIPESIVNRVKDYLSSCGLDPKSRYLGLHTGSDPKFVEKRWPAENFAKVAETIYEKFGFSAIVFDGPSEPGTGIRVARAAKTPVHALQGWGNLEDAWGLMSLCALFVSNDSGLMNLAEASGVPTVALFGPSELHRTRPYLGHAVKSKWNCSPCYTLKAFPGCPFHAKWCMSDLNVEQVLLAIDKVDLK